MPLKQFANQSVPKPPRANHPSIARRPSPNVQITTSNKVIALTEIFVAVLGASSYTYAEATWSQQLPDWIASHVRCFEVAAATLPSP